MTKSKWVRNDNEEWEDVTRITALSLLVPSYDIYLGTDPYFLELVQSGSPHSQFKPESLLPQTTYYWQVVAKRSPEEIRGAIWEFTTEK